MGRDDDAPTATVTATGINARGVTADAASLAVRLDLLRGAAGKLAIETDFIVVDAGIPLQDLCRRNLAQAVTGPVTFAESATAIRTSSYALLDRIVEIANECRDFAVTISGHSDASGSDAWNRRLSLARAEAVADYLVKSGVDAARVSTRGLGSSEPIADNATAAGRSLNRRIEFGLEPASL
jgi:outer membrane protein OmpA-like peptidoglycan-associated protein